MLLALSVPLGWFVYAHLIEWRMFTRRAVAKVGFDESGFIHRWIFRGRITRVLVFFLSVFLSGSFLLHANQMPLYIWEFMSRISLTTSATAAASADVALKTGAAITTKLAASASAKMAAKVLAKTAAKATAKTAGGIAGAEAGVLAALTPLRSGQLYRTGCRRILQY